MRTAYRRVAAATGLLLLVPLVAMQFTDEVVWTPFDFVFAAVLFGGTGVLLTLVATRPHAVVPAAAAAALGLAAIALGENGDAPGLVAFGGLLIVAVAALALRARRRPAG